MSSDFQVYMFTFEAVAEILRRSDDDASLIPITGSFLDETVKAFNITYYKQIMADELRKGLEEYFAFFERQQQRQITIDVDISAVKQGSIVIIGTVLLTTFGSFLWDTIKTPLSEVLQMRIKKALEGFLERHIPGSGSGSNPNEIKKVTINEVAKGTGEKKTGKAPVSAVSYQRRMPGYIPVLTIINTLVILLLLLFLLAPHIRFIP